MEKEWYNSNGKRGALILGGAALVLLCVSVGTKQLNPGQALEILMGLGGALGLWGIRNAQR